LDENIRQQLINEFREYIDSGLNAGNATANADRSVDLYSLLQELVALKTEVKIEARQFKSSLDQFQSALNQLNSEKSYLSECLEQTRAGIEQEKDAALRALLLQLLDIRDRLFEGLKAAENYRKRGFSWCQPKREQALIEGLRNGQALTLKRLDQLLASYDVVPIPVLDQRFEPVSMRAAEVENRPDLENGRVTGELRRGYLWRDKVLRAAEVKVNKVE
jgi:molecular chaperone GrpE